MTRTLLVFVLLVFFSLATAAQERQGQASFKGFVVGGVDVMDNLGYTNPVANIGGGIEVSSRAGLTISQFSFSIAHKIESKDGHARGWENASYLRFNKFLLGGGTKYSHQTTSQWQKGAWRPFLGMGYDGADYRLQVRYVIPAFDAQNRLSGIDTVHDIRASEHWGVEIRYGIYRFQDTRVPGVYYAQAAEKHTGAETGLGLKYYF